MKTPIDYLTENQAHAMLALNEDRITKDEFIFLMGKYRSEAMMREQMVITDFAHKCLKEYEDEMTQSEMRMLARRKYEEVFNSAP